MSNNSFYTRFKETSAYRIIKYIVNSASVALLLAVLFFVVQECNESQRAETVASQLNSITQDMLLVQESLSTRSLGIYPSYVDKINDMLENVQNNPEKIGKDTIIIFEDVLYYGIRSTPKQFVRMIHLLLGLADQGHHIVLAYYDPSENNLVFDRYAQEQHIDLSFYRQMRADIFSSVAVKMEPAQRKAAVDSIVQHYYEMSRISSEEKKTAFIKKVNGYRNKLYSEDFPVSSVLDLEMAKLCCELDSIKTYYMKEDGVDEMRVTFSDFLNMDRSMTTQIKKHLLDKDRENFIEIIEMNDYLTMSCWLIDGQAILAFPSKYASDEIGFISVDKAFINYINTMLEGVRASSRQSDRKVKTQTQNNYK